MNKITKVFVSLFACVAIFFMSIFANNTVVFGAVANITKIIFTTDSQSIVTGVVSGDISIQTQNSGDTAESLDETGDLYLTSSSATGQFSSSATSWTPATTFTMNKTWANRKFYYKDSSIGTFVITAKLTTRITGKSWTTTQNITVGSTSDVGEETVTDAPITTTDSNTSDTVTDSNSGGSSINTSSGNSSGTISTHYIQESLSNYAEPTNIFEVSAGRDRLSYINSPVSFVVKRKISKDLESTGCSYIWSFGDGTSYTGEKVEHLYKYIGDYNVVLNGSCGDRHSVSRTSIKVILPKVSISKKIDGAIEIYNKGKNEINLYKWRILSETQSYTFPVDTIISAGKNVMLPTEYLKISTVESDIILVDASGAGVAQVNLDVYSESENKVISIADLERFVSQYKKVNQSGVVLSLAPKIEASVANVNYLPNISDSQEVENQAEIPLTASVLSVNNTDSDIQSDEDVSTSNSGSEAAETTTVGFWGKLFHPIRTIRETFYK